MFTALHCMFIRPTDTHPRRQRYCGSEINHWTDEFEQLPLIRVMMDAIEHAQYVHEIHHVNIDNLHDGCFGGEQTP